MKLLEQMKKDTMAEPQSTKKESKKKSSGDENLRDERLSDFQTLSLEEKLNMLQERSNETTAFLDTLGRLKEKLENKKGTIKAIIDKKVEENLKEVTKWRDLLFTVVDECLNEKIEKLTSQERFLGETQKEMKKVLDSSSSSTKEEGLDEEEEDSEDPQLDDLLALDLKLEPNVLTQSETTEVDSAVRRDFTVLLAEPKKSLRRTFAYVAGIIRGYLRRGKSNIDWIKAMRRLEGRELEECMFSVESDPSPYIGTRVILEDEHPQAGAGMVYNNTWNTISAIYENRSNEIVRAERVKQLYQDYDRNPEDVEFYLPQLCNMLLQYNDFQPLKDFILAKCTKSFHFALRAYLLIRANKDSRTPPQKKKLIPKSIMKWRRLCDSLLAEIVNAVCVPTLPNGEQTDVNRYELFQIPITLMENLTLVSKELAALWGNPEKFHPELNRLLDIQNVFLQTTYKENPAAFAYVPLLKDSGSPDFHKVVAVPVSEAFPIPTYGRVLFYVWLEVIDIPEQGNDAKLDEHKKKKKDKKKKKEKGQSGEDTDGSTTEDGQSPKISPRGGKTPEDMASPTHTPAHTPKKKLSEKTLTMAHQDTQITSAFGELMEDRMKRVRKTSAYGSLPTWRMQPLIVKYGDQVLQEEFAMQLVVCFQRIFHQEAVPVKLVPYRILAVSSKSGLIEPVPNSLSLDKLKKKHTNLLNFFMQTFGEPSEPSFKQAQQNFVKTMAGYSVVCYLLQLKDRHDGNVLLDSNGDIVHIDFGFLLSHTVPFERAPFKLTPEFVEVMGGYNSPCYKQYRQLCVKAFLAARRHYKQILMIIEMTMEGKGRKVLPCLKAGRVVLEDMTKRFCLDLTDAQCKDLMHNLIEEARGSWRTIVYNAYQLILNNIH